MDYDKKVFRLWNEWPFAIALTFLTREEGNVESRVYSHFCSSPRVKGFALKRLPLLIANVIICVTTAYMNYVKVAEYCKSSFSGLSEKEENITMESFSCGDFFVPHYCGIKGFHLDLILLVMAFTNLEFLLGQR